MACERQLQNLSAWYRIHYRRCLVKEQLNPILLGIISVAELFTTQ